MNEPNLLSICAIAFVAVMLLLGLQALIIRLMTQWFPERKSDQELITQAIQQAVTDRFPGAKVVAVDEFKPAPLKAHAAH